MCRLKLHQEVFKTFSIAKVRKHEQLIKIRALINFCRISFRYIQFLYFWRILTTSKRWWELFTSKASSLLHQNVINVYSFLGEIREKQLSYETTFGKIYSDWLPMKDKCESQSRDFLFRRVTAWLNQTRFSFQHGNYQHLYSLPSWTIYVLCCAREAELAFLNWDRWSLCDFAERKFKLHCCLCLMLNACWEIVEFFN